MKKLLVLLLVFVAIFTMAGCSIDRCDVCNEYGATHV